MNPENAHKKTYHHGDLRAALVAEGLRLVAERDAEALSLREVARGVGVTATSVYRHFPDKQALLAALAREGLDRLAQAQRDAQAGAGGGKAGFAATGRAYVRFALANPGLFRLIFASPDIGAVKKDGVLDSDAGQLLRANAAAEAKHHGSQDEHGTTIRAWAIVHGLAMLMLDGQVAPDDGLIERVIGVNGCAGM